MSALPTGYEDRGYYLDQHALSLKAHVTEIVDKDGRQALVLDSTLFYPGGGGQPADLGMINGRKVTEVFELPSGVLAHTLDGEGAQFQVGQTVSEDIDLDHRMNYQIEHTAEHLLSGLFELEASLHNVGTHLGEGELSIEVDAKEPSVQLGQKIALRGQEIVSRALPVETFFCETGEQAAALGVRSSIKAHGKPIRIVRIPGIDVVGCGGVHCTSTSEVGPIFFTGCDKAHGQARYHFTVGKGLYALLQKSLAVSNAVCTALSAPLEEAAAAFAKETAKVAGERRELSFVSERLGQLMAQSADQSQSVFRLSAEENPATVEGFIRSLKGQRSALYLVLFEKNGRLSFALGDPNGGLPQSAQGLLDTAREQGAQVSGGGKGAFLRGSIGDTASQKTLSELFEKLIRE